MKAREIVINGLTLRQKKMLDMMWSLDTKEEYFEWYSKLSKPMQHQAEILMKMIILAELDEVCDLVFTQEVSLTEAREVLGKFTLKGHL
jgi:hypothetical protein